MEEIMTTHYCTQCEMYGRQRDSALDELKATLRLLAEMRLVDKYNLSPHVGFDVVKWELDLRAAYPNLRPEAR